MITRFFSRSKPIHLVLTALFALFLFFWMRKDQLVDALSIGLILEQLGMYIVVFGSIALLSFMVNKNTLTLRNNFAILLFVLLIAMMPFGLKDNSILWSNFFVLLALRRIISLKSNINVKKKLLDASIWISIASLFYFWSILFFGLIFGALFLFAIPNLKNWSIPFIGIAIVAIIATSYSIITTGTIDDFSWFIQPLNYDFSNYNNLQSIIAITLILSLGIWALFFYIRSISDKPKALRSAHILVMYAALTGLIIIGVTPQKNGTEFLFLFAPLAIVMANYLEAVSDRWFGELFVWLIICSPIVALLL